MPMLDYTGADGGRLALAFGAGVTFCAGVGMIILRFVWSIIGKTYEKRIAALESENHRCEDRVRQLEVLLFMHGPQALRQEMQAALSENHIEMLRGAQAERQAKGGK